MPLVAAMRTQCGGVLDIDSSKDAAVCPFCATPFITEKAIHNYTTHNQNNFQIQNANIQMNDEHSIESKLKSAEIFLTVHGDFKKAKELFYA